MASLQARHSRSCALARPWTPVQRQPDGDPLAGCTCKPTFYTVVRDGTKLHREKIGKNRKLAQRALNKVSTQEDEGSYEAPKEITFRQWSDRWLARLRRKDTTLRTYRASMRLACDVFGDKSVRRLTADDVGRFITHLGERTVTRSGEDGKTTEHSVSSTTQNKHLRALGTCLTSAVKQGYAVRNPVAMLPTGERPQPERQEAGFFTDAEIPKLLCNVTEGTMRVLFTTAVSTGMRQGELLGLTWADVDLQNSVIDVRRTYTEGAQTVPKNHQVRRVDIAGNLVKLLGEWWGECGGPGDDKLVFPGTRTDGYVSGPTTINRELYRAMAAAGIPKRDGESRRRSFHSLRHTYARRVLEAGGSEFWLSRQLGHKTLRITTDTYGHFAREARKDQVRKLEKAGAFRI